MMSFLAPSDQATLVFGASGAYPVFDLHRWWTVLSAAWLHANRSTSCSMCSGFVSSRRRSADAGAGRMVIIYTVAASSALR
jgi:rhomboid protease GluP